MSISVTRQSHIKLSIKHAECCDYTTKCAKDCGLYKHACAYVCQGVRILAHEHAIFQSAYLIFFNFYG